jgi:nucleoid-associated protein YgaU
MDVSPALGLADENRGQRTGGLLQQPTELTNLVPPPTLPVSFQPSTVSPDSSDWRPGPVARLPRPKVQPRPYRLRDGDTLERIAERLLGNVQRAGDIFELNRGLLSRPDLLPVGVTIMLPPRESGDDLEPVITQP